VCVYVCVCVCVRAMQKPKLADGCGEEDYRVNSIECGLPAKNVVQVLLVCVCVCVCLCMYMCMLVFVCDRKRLSIHVYKYWREGLRRDEGRREEG